MRALLTATAILLVAVPAVAQPKVDGGATRWTFDVVTMRHIPGRATVKRTPYGMFTSRDECEIARAKKVAELDQYNYRQPYLVPSQDSRTTTTGAAAGAASITLNPPTSTVNAVGAATGMSSTIIERPSGTVEHMNVNDCRVS
jgi:hypothetical protein